MNIPNDATHYCEHNGLYYKQTNNTVYVWSSNGYWLESIGLPLNNHEFIRPIKRDS